MAALGWFFQCVRRISKHACIMVLILCEQKQPPKRFFKISVLFFQEQPFYNFRRGSICSSNRHVFLGRSICSSNRNVFSRRVYLLFAKQIVSSNVQILIFSKTLIYLVLENIQIFQKPLFSIQKDIPFPQRPIYSSNTYYLFYKRALCLEQIEIFKKNTPRRTDILLIGFGGCFRYEPTSKYNFSELPAPSLAIA